MKNKQKIFFLIISILTIIVATVGVTYAFLSVNAVQTDPNIIESACFSTTFTEGNSINLVSYPMSDTKGLTTIPYTFSIKNNCSENASYQVILNIKNTTDSDVLKHIVYSVDGTNSFILSDATKITLPPNTTSSNVTASYLIDAGSIGNIATKNYNLRLWLASHGGNSLMTKKFEAEIMVYSSPTSLNDETIEQVSLTNLITDPTFDSNNWSISPDSTRAKYGNKSLKLTGTTGTTEVVTTNKNTMNLDNTHKYYGRFEAYPTVAGLTGGIYWPIAEPSFNDGTSLGAANQWNIVSSINTRTSFTSGNQSYRLDFNNNNTAANVWYDGVMMIDLTAAFGAGNEPDKTWCDNNIPFFEGTKKIKYISTKS